MTSIFTKVAIAAVLGLSTLAAIPATASARDTGIYIGFGGQRHHETYRHHQPRHERHERRVYRASCSSGQAVYKASRIGLRAAHVTRRSPGRVVVEGRHHHRHSRIVFANTRGCPIIR